MANPADETTRWERIADYCRAQGPDILVLCNIPVDPALEALDARFAARGPAFVDRAVCRNDGEASAHAVWSARPILWRNSRTGLRYRAGGRPQRLENGLLDIAVSGFGGRALRIVAANLKDKTFHPGGQSEMRRNEARLLARHLHRTRSGGGQTGDLLVFAGLHDTPDSAPVRELTGGGPLSFIDLRPGDALAHVWTVHDPQADIYARSHYALASPALAERLRGGQVRILDDRRRADLSRVRPIWLEGPNPGTGIPGGEKE